MGHREDLLEGAKRCLREKGYARTTTRDIVAVSNTNLASIGYHFGSKENLLNEALIDALGEWGKELEGALAAAIGQDGGALERFESIWSRLVELFANDRALCAANIEVFAQIEHVPTVRQVLADGLEQGREGLGRLFGTVSEDTDQETARAVGSFYQALVTGVMVQWLIDPGHAPSGHDLTVALRQIAAGLMWNGGAREPEPEHV
ncbi:TetR/AcrR family transcriptional regulator [Microbispora amethystogenes]|uniref:TetR family transcriptional regulator n=1 Tax=Microbispora amethystogenes TaxID=1427754 RepID=A0ABQ4FNY3_9ACTN|nr:TetR/AcrR family transcriptional regulator [Microbispora amethystogenes]GIH36525.1 TetR family transcriptional regulator [Microbispora amethystogenes]